MNLNLKKAFESILHWRKPPDKECNDPVSIVMLLREPKFLTLEELRFAGEKAFGKPFTDNKKSHYCVIQTTIFTLMQAGLHTLSFLNYKSAYGGSYSIGKKMPTSSQRQAWAEHTAWTAVDYVNGGVNLELEYAVLAKLCAEMLDMNCAGLYIPGEKTFIPNNESLHYELKRITVPYR